MSDPCEMCGYDWVEGDATSKAIDDQKAEIEHLKADWRQQAETAQLRLQKIEAQQQLIIDLVDELDFWEQSEGFLWGEPELKKRAREATR